MDDRSRCRVQGGGGSGRVPEHECMCGDSVGDGVGRQSVCRGLVAVTGSSRTMGPLDLLCAGIGWEKRRIPRLKGAEWPVA